MKFFLTLSVAFITLASYSQDMLYARHLIDTLASPAFWGRGYTKQGMAKAADFIEAEFRKAGLHGFSEKFQQPFMYPANTFPGKMMLSIDGKQMIPGIDFIVSPESRGLKASGKLIQQDSIRFFDRKNKIEVILRNKLTWSVLNETSPYTRIELDRRKVSKHPSRVAVDIENKFIPKFNATNVCGYVKGTTHADSLLVITAHYDHLGGMGADTYFPGANDNASGVALLIELAKYYAKNPIQYSIAFVAFGGEEAGLRGSAYFVQHPLFPIEKIRFLTNLDLTGTGDDGIAVVNAQVFKREFAMFSEINQSQKLFTQVKARGKAANSDHYWFTELGVPSFFIYAMGGIQAYHDVNDKAETLPLTEFQDLFRLITDFNEKLVHNRSRKF